jgi:hypothetical protein
MTPIKILLIIPLGAILLFLISRLRNPTVYRFTFIVFAIVGIVFVIDPELTNSIAHRLNVSRGADLLFYFCVVVGFCVMLVFYSKIRSLEAMQTEIIREHAIEMAKKKSG